MKRLDQLLVEKGLCPTRERAQALILAGKVFHGEQRLDKAGFKLKPDTALEIRGQTLPYVSRAGEKLAAAIKLFGLNVQNKFCLDVGASTGGFTDCLLQHGAKKVFAVDVGYGQLDIKLRTDPRVALLERQNARHLTKHQLSELDAEAANAVSVVTMDCSFISLRLLVEPLQHIVQNPSEWILLFKPQFEVGREGIKKGGIPKSQSVVAQAQQDFEEWMQGQGFRLSRPPESSPIRGKKSGNVELLYYYEKP